MTEIIFILSLTVILSAVYTVSFRLLPDEKWQIFATIPLYKTGDNSWHGINITYYGLLTATGYTLAFTIFIIMMSAAGTDSLFLLVLLAAILLFFIPSAKIMAVLIEKKKHTLTVGGAVFVMFILAPWIISCLNRVSIITHDHQTADIVFFSSLITAYAFGEGFGRLACISFGCCYGKAVSELPVFFQKLFSYYNFVYTGKTKKISYHDNMDGVKTVPVQAITAVLYTASGLAGLYLFLDGKYLFSFFLSLTVTQVWRFISEFLRADFRGYGNISAYQVMSIMIVPYYIIYTFIFGMPDYLKPSISHGLSYVWSPGLIILLLIMWIGCVLYTGVSSVTASTISIYINEDKI